MSRKNQRWSLGLFLIVILLTVCAAGADPIVNINDNDMKQIVGLLFERELANRSAGTETTVLLDPNLDAKWIPELPGIRFKRLSHEEERLGMEYYRLSGPELRNNALIVGLLKGNLCKKAGRRYKVRRHGRSWVAEPVGYLESSGGPGSFCIGCKLDSGAVYSIKALDPNSLARSGKDEKRSKLALTGKVQGVICSQMREGFVECAAALSLKFSNISTQPVIILQPHGLYEFWHGGTSLSLSRSDSNRYSYVYTSSAWPSVFDSAEYRLLSEELDQAEPPPGLTRILGPGESWVWDTEAKFALAEENHCSMFVGVEIGWNEIKKLPAPLWLTVSYEMWPFNVENSKPDLGGSLRKRWRAQGDLFLDSKIDNYWQARLASEPIEFDLRRVELSGDP